MDLDLGDRRRIVEKARGDADFLSRLKADGRAAIAEETGVALPETMRIRIVEEGGGVHLAGVLPREEALAAGLPEPERVRDMWENMLLQAVAMRPEAREELLADPIAFARTLDSHFPGETLTIYPESATETVLVIDPATDDEELDADALDHISAGSFTGGEPLCKTASA